MFCFKRNVQKGKIVIPFYNLLQLYLASTSDQGYFKRSNTCVDMWRVKERTWQNGTKLSKTMKRRHLKLSV